MPTIIPNKNLGFDFYMPSFGVAVGDISKQNHPQYVDDLESMQDDVQRVVREGMRCISTPVLDNNVEVLRRFGDSIHTMDRSKVFLIAKVTLRYNHFFDTVNAVIYTLKYLGIDQIDLCLVELANRRLYIPTVMNALSYLVDKGFVKSLGAVNFSESDLTTANFASTYRVHVNMIDYNLLNRNADASGLMRYCSDNGIFVLANDPLAGGELETIKHPVIDELCKKYKKTSAQIAMRWLLFQTNVVTLTDIDRIDHLYEDLEMLEFNLSGHDFEVLNRAFKPEQVGAPA